MAPAPQVSAMMTPASIIPRKGIGIDFIKIINVVKKRIMPSEISFRLSGAEIRDKQKSGANILSTTLPSSINTADRLTTLRPKSFCKTLYPFT